MLLLSSGVFQELVVFGDAFRQTYRTNETIPLRVSLPTPTTDEKLRKGLLWQGLSVATSSNDYLLHPTSGFVENGHICGILGPSGAGKTTFLSSIAGRPESSLQVNGEVLHYRVEGQTPRVECAPVLQGSVAWLQQHDAFFERLTVKETLDMAAFLELPHLSMTERTEVAKNCLDSLGLAGLQSRPVGSPKASRTNDGVTLSGGEMRRLSVAVELVTMPNLFIADEPTSGIDSKMSENVMAAIASMARQKDLPCFCTLHQPRSSIWKMLDSVILMAPGGRVCYSGSRKDALSFFADLGYECPSLTNPAEFLIDLVSVDPEDPIQAKKDKDRIQQLFLAFSRHTKEQANKSAGEVCTASDSIHPVNESMLAAARHPFRVSRRFGALFRRSWRQNIRSTGLNVFRLAVSTGTALLLSQIFPSVSKGEDPKPKSVADRVALLSFGVINMMMTAVMKTMDVFAKEKPVVQREHSRKLYSSLEYLLSKSVAEIPLDAAFAVCFTTALKLTTGLAISWNQMTATFSLMTVAGASLGFLIGSMTPSQEAAISSGIPILIVMMIVGVINPSGVDPSVKKSALIEGVKTFSPIAAAIEALAVGEFSGMKFASDRSFLGWRRLRDVSKVGGVALVKNGDEVLDALGLRTVEFGAVMRHMTRLSALNFSLCWCFLQFSNGRWVGRLRRQFRRASNLNADHMDREETAVNAQQKYLEQRQKTKNSTGGNTHPFSATVSTRIKI